VFHIWFVGSSLEWYCYQCHCSIPPHGRTARNTVGVSWALFVYASQHLWASILSWSLLHETVGGEDLLGGMPFLAVLFLAAMAESVEHDNHQEMSEV